MQFMYKLYLIEIAVLCMYDVRALDVIYIALRLALVPE